jgi:uncharacterized protein YbjT (DUF2867 family)
MHDALLAGATGLIGRELVAGWHGPGQLHLMVRRAMPVQGACTQIHRVDFSALPALPSARDAYCALGTTIKVAGSKAAFRAVDFDAVLAFARAAKAAGVQRFGVVSALGADAVSSNFYTRVKGEMEAALIDMGFDSLVVARPSLLAGDREVLGQPVRLAERLSLTVLQPMSALMPAAWRPVEAAKVARALRHGIQQGQQGTVILSSADMQSA